MAEFVVQGHDMLGAEGLGRAFVIESLIGFVLTFTVTGGITLLDGAGWGPAMATGAFAGAWGGRSFGGKPGVVGRSGTAGS